MKKVICISVFFLTLTLSFATTSSAPEISCPSPQNVTKVAEGSGTISFDWDGCDGCGQTFEVYFVVNGSTSTTYSVSSSDITFTSLGTGTYEFHFRTVCGGSTSSEIIVTEDVVVL